MGNPSATWSLQSTTGGVVSGDLVASGPSAVFTGHLTGTAIIRAFASGFVGNSGTQTVSAGAANKLAFTTQPGGGQPGTAWAAQPVVSVQDAGGNNIGFIGMTIEPGPHKIELSYLPVYFYQSMLVSILGLLIFTGAIFGRRFRKS